MMSLYLHILTYRTDISDSLNELNLPFVIRQSSKKHAKPSVAPPIRSYAQLVPSPLGQKEHAGTRERGAAAVLT